MSDSYQFPTVEHFTAGTIGPKGQRTFYVQFGNHGQLVSLKLEKGQVAALAEYLDSLLDDVDPIGVDDTALALELIEPVEAAWAVSTLGVALTDDGGRLILVAEELVPDDVDDEPATAEVHVSPAQVKAFIERARDLVAAGRPPCQFCGRPLDGDDMWCPCHN